MLMAKIYRYTVLQYLLLGLVCEAICVYVIIVSSAPCQSSSGSVGKSISSKPSWNSFFKPPPLFKLGISIRVSPRFKADNQASSVKQPKMRHVTGT